MKEINQINNKDNNRRNIKVIHGSNNKNDNRNDSYDKETKINAVNDTKKIRSTIIIPNYNGIKYIEKCLRSLNGENAYIIVVDNGSTDGSREIVRERFPEVRLKCLDRNYGFCTAVNCGIEDSKTTYVILLNNDTEVQPGFVDALERAMDRHAGAFSGGAQMRNLHRPELIDDAGDYYCALGWAFARGKDKSAERYQQECRIFAACGGAAILRRSILKRIGGLDENHFAYLEDIDLGYRARIHGYYNIYIPEAVVYHAGSGASGSRYNKFKVDLTSKNSVYLLYKNMPVMQIILNFPLLLAGFAIKTLFFIRKGLGKDYLKGLCRGVELCASREGKRHKVPYQRKHLRNYIVIQLELWRNVCYRIFG